MNIDQIIPQMVVRHRHRPGTVGVLTGNVIKGLVPMVEVKWADETAFEPLAALEVFTANEDQSFESLVAKGRYGDLDSMRSLMTFEKLRGDLSNVVYCMRTAEIDFYPHQFLPVLKFVQSPLGRLLIADEVGLGKTIEAALIWTECQARFKARRLLVICPPTLIPKWIRELQDRFGIDAQYANAKGLLEQFKNCERKGAGQGFAIVTSYHALRPRRNEKRYLQPWLSGHSGPLGDDETDEKLEKRPRVNLFRGLLEWNHKHSFADLVVFDEAHLMKNTATATHIVGEVFSSSSQGVLALSATPLNNQTRDLYALLKLVDPDMFRDEATFNALRERNRPAVLLANELGRTAPDFQRCAEHLQLVPPSAAKDHLALHLNNHTISPGEISPSERVSMLSKAQRLNELGAFLNRTRKVEVFQNKVTRDAVTLNVKPTPEESAFYNGVLKLIRRRVAERGDVLSVFHLISPALTMASCLPVMAAKLRDGRSRWGDLDDLAALDDPFEAEDESEDFVCEEPQAIADDLTWVRNHDFDSCDTKYARLRDELLKRTPTDKVIIFAFFKDTLRYLQRRLEQDGMNCILVTGDVKTPEERDALLRSFETPESRVLLCSEVAAEGVDLQFCRIMVNYDLPWNPMRVEQRIGRIDRIGQAAQTIVIINFNVEGTIDGSICVHLHHKIGVFTQTVGDLEGIMGQHISSLTREILVDELSAAQIEQKIVQTAAAIENERVITREVNDESDSLIGLRSILQDSVSKGETLGRYIKANELRRFTDEFFAETYGGNQHCQLSWDSPDDQCLTLHFSFEAMSDFESFLRQNDLHWPKGFNTRQRLAALTFSPQQFEQSKKKHRNLILANHLHPFVQWMTSTRRERSKSWHAASASILSSMRWAAGGYLFLIMRLSLSHPAMSRKELVFRALRLDSGEVLSAEDSEALVNDLLEAGRSWGTTRGYPDYSVEFDGLVEAANEDCRAKQEAFGEDLELRVNSKRAQITNHFRSRIEGAERRLEIMAQRGDRARGIRLMESQVEALHKRLEEELSILNGDLAVTPQFKRVACGLIRIQPNH